MENWGGGPPRGTSMHKDESTGANVAPTNQSDSGWRAQLSWHLPNCDRNMSHIQPCVCVCVCVCATMSTDTHSGNLQETTTTSS